MKHTSLGACLISIILLAGLDSCKKDNGAFVQLSPGNGNNNVASSPTLSCTPVSGALSYVFSLTDGAGTISKTVSTDTVTFWSLSPCDNYTWAVTANKADGSSVTTSPSWVFTTAPINNVPCLSSPASGSTDICINPTFNWSTVSASAYYLEVGSDAAFRNVVFGHSVSSGNYTFGTSYLSPGTQYFWHVSAGGAYSATYTFTTVAVPSLQSPDNHATSASRSPSFSWSSTSCTSDYTLDISTASNFSSNLQSVQVSGSSYSISQSAQLTAFTTYFWRVRVNSYTAISPTFTFTTGL